MSKKRGGTILFWGGFIIGLIFVIASIWIDTTQNVSYKLGLTGMIIGFTGGFLGGWVYNNE